MEIRPFWQMSAEVDDNTTLPMESGIGVDFSFFSGDDAKKIDGGAQDTSSSTSKKRSKPKVAVNGEVLPERDLVNPIHGAAVAEVDYARSYAETNNLIRGAIMQSDELSNEIKQDIDAVRSSKTIKNKFTYITNLTASASALLNTKISAIKELNSTITQAHNLELNRMKTMKVNEAEANDDAKMMDIYSAFVNTPIGTYTPSTPNIQDLTLGVNNPNGPVAPIEMVAANGLNANLTAEQNRMRMENNPNIQTVVRYNQSTGQRMFDVIDSSTMASIPNYPRPDAFLLEDTTIDVHAGIARNRNINTVWPLVVDGSNVVINEY